MSTPRISVLGITFDPVRLDESLQILSRACKSHKQLFCVTPNPEICMACMRSPSFKKLLKSADLSIPDGFGILWAARFLSGSRSIWSWFWTLCTPFITKRYSPLPERVTGTDLMDRFCHQNKKEKIFLLGASKTVNERLAKHLINEGVNIVGNFSGNDSKKLEPIIRSMINSTDARVLFVAFGAPRQEQWISRNLKNLKKVRVAIGVGGAFDFLAGKRKRAPKWMRAMGLEWLFRLLIEPKRIRRIFRATILFPISVYRMNEKSTVKCNSEYNQSL